MWRHACILASLFENAVRTTARPRRRRIRLPAIGSRYLRSLLRASLDLPFFPPNFWGEASIFSEILRQRRQTWYHEAILSPHKCM